MTLPDTLSRAFPTAQAALADALIEAELVTENRKGDAMFDAQDVLDCLREIGWDVTRKDVDGAEK